MNNIQSKSQHDIINFFLEDIRFPHLAASDVQRDIILTEFLRSCLYLLSFNSLAHNEFQPVYIRRLTDMVRYHLDAVWPDIRVTKKSSPFNQDDSIETDKYSFDWILGRLEILGEFTELSNGYWLPSPFRLILLPQTEEIAVIGGMGFQQLNCYLPKLKITGFGRILQKSDLTLELKNNDNWWQDFESWLGWVPKNLVAWTDGKIKQFKKNSSNSSTTFTDFEVFTPIFKSTQDRTWQTWVAGEELLIKGRLDGINVCRTLKPNRYFLGRFTGGRLMAEEAVLDMDTIRWLILGLQYLQGAKPIAIWDGNNLRLKPFLPKALDRYISIYSYKLPIKSQSVYYIPGLFHMQVEKILQKYGYKVQYSKERLNYEE